jgi:hypothetical protein
MALTGLVSDAQDVVVGGALVLGTVVGAPLLRRRYRTWGATAAEAERTLPGDEVVRGAQLTSTRAIDIAAAPETVWAWLVQIGHDRGGLYSYDGLENLFGCDLHSTDRVDPDLQHLGVGDVVAAGPPGYPAWQVVDIAPPHHLVLVAIDPRTRALPPLSDAPPPRGFSASSWQWVLEPSGDGRRTRLLVRTRTAYSRELSTLWHVVEPVSFVMERRMLLGLKSRAEASA